MGLNKIKITDIFVYIAVVIWCSIYAFSVNRVLDPYYGYVIDYEKEFSYVRFITCLIIIEGLLFITKKTDNKYNILLNYIKMVLFVYFLIPSIMSYCLQRHRYSFEYTVYCIIYWFFFCLFSKYVTFKISPITKNHIRFSKKYENIVVLAISFLIIAYIIDTVGVINISLSLSDVYKVRAAFKENSTFLGSVLKSTLGIYILPMMVVKCIAEKQYLLAASFSFCQIIAFSMAKDKSYLFSLIIAMIVGIFGYKMVASIWNWIGIALLGLSGLNLLACFGVYSNLIFNVFTRRSFVSPPWLQYINFEYFHDLPKLWWRQDTFLIDKLFMPVYDRSVIEIISEDYFHGIVLNPNCGIIGEAFTRCGYLGVIIYPFLIAVMFNILYLFFAGTKREMMFAFAIAIGGVMTNDVITSTAFVEIIILVCAFMYILRKAKESSNDLAMTISMRAYDAKI